MTRVWKNFICGAATLAGLAALVACMRPVPDGDRRSGFRVAVIGDFGSDDADEAGVAKLVKAWHPDLVATVGDNNYPSGSAETIDANVGKYYHEFIAPYSGRYGQGAAENRFFPALGNHDWKAGSAQPYLDYFDLPGNERYYAVRRGALELFILDSDENEPDGITRDSVQAGWLRSALAASTARYRIVLLHHPPFSSGQHHSSPTVQWPFREWGATAVLAGHDHDYERIDRAGMPYVVVGTGGKRLYGFTRPAGGSQVRFPEEHGALLIEVRDERASARFVTSGGVVLDSFALPADGELPVATPLIAASARWKYLAGGEIPGERWRTNDFDDSRWTTTGERAARTANAKIRRVDFTRPAKTTFTSSFLRRRFEIPDPSAFGWIELALPPEDEVVANLNGVEVVRAAHTREPGHSTTLSHLLIDPNSLVAGENLVAIELRHRGGGPKDPARFEAELVGYSPTEELLGADDIWQRQPGGAAPPGWKSTGFDDSAWPRAPLPLAVPDTIRLRCEFQVMRRSAFRQLLLHVARTGSGIVYLNRTEVARWNLPDPDLGLLARAPADLIGLENAPVEIPVAAALLADGENVLAIELQPRKGIDSNPSFDVALRGVR